jgi:hypothetical protein
VLIERKEANPIILSKVEDASVFIKKVPQHGKESELKHVGASLNLWGHNMSFSLESGTVKTVEGDLPVVSQ